MTTRTEPAIDATSHLLESRVRLAARRREAAQRDAQAVSEAPALRARAELLKTAASRVKRYDREVVLTDYASGTPTPVRIALSPGLTALEQVERMFRRAKRLAGAEEKVRARLAQVEREYARARAVQKAWADALAAGNHAALAEIAAELHDPRGPSPAPRAAQRQAPAKPYRVYLSASGREIWVGKGASKNDALTFKHASPHAQWLHAAGWQGAHVVVQKKKNEALDPATLEAALRLAAHFSKAPKNDRVEVTVAEVKFVRKFKNAKPGQVMVTREARRLIDNDPQKVATLIHHGPKESSEEPPERA